MVSVHFPNHLAVFPQCSFTSICREKPSGFRKLPSYLQYSKLTYASCRFLMSTLIPSCRHLLHANLNQWCQLNVIHFLIILKILHTIHATLFLIKLYFSKAVDVFYSTLRARITSKKDHQVLIDRVMNLGCKRTKLLCNLAAGGLCVKSKFLRMVFFF